MTDKLKWITEDFIELASALSREQKGRWGVMNAQQMVEHMSDFVRQGNGKDNRKLVTPAEHLEKYRAFVLSDRPFRENTKNIELPDTPFPLKNNSMPEALEELRNELSDFISYFDHNKDAVLTNSIFGELNYEQWVHLLHKHAQHHARQFGLIE